MINFRLLTCIFTFIQEMERTESWDMSTGENEKFGEVLYNELMKGYPESRKELDKIFDVAYSATWGSDHRCDNLRDSEVAKFVDYFLEDYSKAHTPWDVSHQDWLKFREKMAVSNYVSPASYMKLASKLPNVQITQILDRKDANQFVIAGVVEDEFLQIVLGDLSHHRIHLSFFSPCAGLTPIFHKFEIIDFGRTLKFGKYESSIDAILEKIGLLEVAR